MWLKWCLMVFGILLSVSSVVRAEDTNLVAFTEAATDAITSTKNTVGVILLSLFGLAVLYFVYRKVRGAMGK